MRVAIVGLGQIGGSMALKLRDLGLQPDLFDLDPKICSLLGGRCEEFEGEGYDLVVLALHIPVLLRVMEVLPPNNLYLDTASVKSQVVEKAKKIGLRFVGGHPIAGNELTGPESWDSTLFERRPFALVDVNCTEQDKELAEKFVISLGASCFWIDSKMHDLALAYTSHALYFVSVALKNIGKPYEDLAGPGYSSMTRLAKQNPKLAEVFAKYNGKNTSVALRKIADEILKMANEVEKCENME